MSDEPVKRAELNAVLEALDSNTTAMEKLTLATQQMTDSFNDMVVAMDADCFDEPDFDEPDFPLPGEKSFKAPGSGNA